MLSIKIVRHAFLVYMVGEFWKEIWKSISFTGQRIKKAFPSCYMSFEGVWNQSYFKIKIDKLDLIQGPTITILTVKILI